MTKAEFRQLALRAKPKVAPFHSPEFGETIYLRQFSSHDAVDYEARFITPIDGRPPKKTDYQSWVFMYGVCDEEGKRLFDESDISWISECSHPSINRIVEEIVRINRLNEEIVEEVQRD